MTAHARGRAIRLRWGAVAFLFFAGYLLAGLVICDDYGVSWDEEINRTLGFRTLEYLQARLGSGSPDVAAAEERMRGCIAEQGPFFEVVLAAVEKVVSPGESREALLLRHRATFLVFWGGALAYFFLLRRLLGHTGLALTGSLLLIATPRIFAHAFYNSKDTVLLALFVVSSLTLIRFLERKTYPAALLHALACAVTIDVRLTGLLLPAVTLALLALDRFRGSGASGGTRRSVLLAAGYLVPLAGFTVLFWPQLWDSPVSRFLGAIRGLGVARQFTHPSTLFNGRFVPVDDLPWYYLPEWMAITIPPIVLVLFLAGAVASVRSFRRRPLLQRENLGRLLVLLLLLPPLAATVLLRPVLYDGWRHFFFVYPALLGIAMLGASELWTFRRWRPIVGVVLLAGILQGGAAVVRDHPYSAVYFNRLAGSDLEDRFELDYWGLSFGEGLRAVLRAEPEGTVPVAVSDVPGRLNGLMLRRSQQQRIRFESLETARYFLSNHRQPQELAHFREGKPPYTHEVYRVERGGACLLGVYRLR
jgi:hypothetical protein